MTKITNRTH